MNIPANFLKGLITKMPIVFPLVGLFHILWLIWVLAGIGTEIFSSELIIRIFWMALYTVFWLAACDRRKWGAIGYLLLTLFNLILYFSLKSPLMRSTYVSSLFLVDVLFSFILLFYYKQFE